MKKISLTLVLLVVCIALGIWIGRFLLPSSIPVGGNLTVLESGAPATASPVGEFLIRWEPENGGKLEVKNGDGRTLWESVPGKPFVLAAIGEENVQESRGMFKVSDNLKATCRQQTVDLIQSNDVDQFTLSGHLYCDGEKSVLYNLYFEPGNNPHSLKMIIWLQDPVTLEQPLDFNRTFLYYATNIDEHFFGFGEQFSYFDLKGQVVPIWSSEQGVGRGEQPLTFFANITNNGAGGNPFNSYAPMPFYITNQMHSLLLANSSYSEFDLTDPEQVKVGTFSPTLYSVIFDGDSPEELIAAHTSLTGRMAPLPDWVHSGAIVGMQGGTQKVRDVLTQLNRTGAPLSAFWLQDWVGQRTTSFGKQLWWNWELDEEHYPGWDTLMKDLAAQDVRVMLYINPNLADASAKPNVRRNLFQEAKEKGYLITNTDGSPYMLTNTSFEYSMVDLTNPDAITWLQTIMQENMLAIGASGWMADFGEALPYDAVLMNGEAPIIHNLYPGYWAYVNRQVTSQDQAQPVFFMRAASQVTPLYASLFWEGDQLVSWDENDGIKTAVTGLNTSGLSGMTINHSDIGGYTTISSPIKNYHRSEELLIRWMELNAFTSIFRTHEGNQPDKNVQFYSDEETLEAFTRNATIFAALFEYRKSLILEASESGLPVVRHPFIQYPDDPETWKITYQEFMLGPDFIIAPVLDEGATAVTAYLPKGEWVHVWSGQVYGSPESGTYVKVDAPIGQPGVFYKNGSAWGEGFVQKLKAEGILP